MSTSSDSGENENLAEAIDPDFLSNDLFQKKDELKVTKPVKLPVSLRKKDDSSSHFNPFEIKVTPEFKAYVSKHLSWKLSKLVDDTQELPENNRVKAKKKDKTGNIKLLRTSRNYLSVSDEESFVLPVKKNKKMKKRKMVDNSSSNSSCDSDEEKAKEVAVTAEWILSGKATEGWATSTKGELEVISVPVSKN